MKEHQKQLTAMGIWKTKTGKRYRLNIGQGQIEKLQKDGARFCRIGKEQRPIQSMVILLVRH